jgi:TraM recognition site of TraD and TraG
MAEDTNPRTTSPVLRRDRSGDQGTAHDEDHSLNIGHGSAQLAPSSAGLRRPASARGKDRSASWVAIDRADHADGTGLGVLEARDGSCYVASFALEMVSVALDGGQRVADSSSATAARTQSDRIAGWSSFLRCLKPGQAVRIVHGIVPSEAGMAQLVVRVEGETAGISLLETLASAHALHHDLRLALAVGEQAFGLRGLAEPSLQGDASRAISSIEPVGLAIDGGATAAGFGQVSVLAGGVILPSPPVTVLPFLDRCLEAMLLHGRPMELSLELRATPLEEGTLHRVRQHAESLLDTNCRRLRVTGGSGQALPSSNELLALQSGLRRWLDEPVAVRLGVAVAGDMVPQTLIRLIGDEVWQGRPYSVKGSISPGSGPVATTVDLSRLILPSTALPPLFPAHALLLRQGFPALFPRVNFEPPRTGTVIGEIPIRNGAVDVRLSPDAGMRNCHVIGLPGVGKSKLLVPMFCAVTERDGGALLDFHGDLVDEVMEKIPEERRDAVILLDFTDPDFLPGLNLLERRSQRPEVERTFILDSMVAMVRQLYPENPEGFGPVFESYFTQGLDLVMEDPDGTILDLPRIFGDPAFRRRRLDACKRPEVSEFFSGIALKAGGEASFDNVAPYIVTKTTRLGRKPLKYVFGQPVSSVDFRTVMDERRILLVKLSKGLMSDAQSHFLSMLIITQVFAAALSRADVPQEGRQRFHVFVDECQNALCPALISMLAESRKYRVGLTLAHQNLAQLPAAAAQAVLANCSSKLVMRVGPSDAALLAPWFGPHFRDSDLISLPDRHAVARIQCDGGISPPFLLRTKSVDSRRADGVAEAIRTQSRTRYCRPVAEVESEIEARRKAEQPPLPSRSENQRRALRELSLAAARDLRLSVQGSGDSALPSQGPTS